MENLRKFILPYSDLSLQEQQAFFHTSFNDQIELKYFLILNSVALNLLVNSYLSSTECVYDNILVQLEKSFRENNISPIGTSGQYQIFQQVRFFLYIPYTFSCFFKKKMTYVCSNRNSESRFFYSFSTRNFWDTARIYDFFWSYPTVSITSYISFYLFYTIHT